MFLAQDHTCVCGVYQSAYRVICHHHVYSYLFGVTKSHSLWTALKEIIHQVSFPILQIYLKNCPVIDIERWECMYYPTCKSHYIHWINNARESSSSRKTRWYLIYWWVHFLKVITPDEKTMLKAKQFSYIYTKDTVSYWKIIEFLTPWHCVSQWPIRH